MFENLGDYCNETLGNALIERTNPRTEAYDLQMIAEKADIGVHSVKIDKKHLLHLFEQVLTLREIYNDVSDLTKTACLSPAEKVGQKEFTEIREILERRLKF